MNEKKTQRELWRNRWLSSINELTSLELQQASWNDRKNKNPHWSFVEFMCSYFDDLVLDDNYETELKDGWITKSEHEIIRPWHLLLDKYNSPKNDDHNIEAILNDKKWLTILKEGQKTKTELSKVLNEAESKILNEEIDYKKYQ